MLNVFEPCTLQIGDRNFYTLKEEDIIMMREEWRILEKESFLGIGNEESCQTGSSSTKSKSRLKKLKKLYKASSEHKGEDESTDEEFEEVTHIWQIKKFRVRVKPKTQFCCLKNIITYRHFLALCSHDNAS